jgi:hypothetical protein
MRKIKIIFLVCLSLILSFSLNSGIYYNDTDPVFPPPDPDPGSVFKVSMTGRGLISDLLIDGAAKFIDSYSEALIILREYEISFKSTFDMSFAHIKADLALKKLEESRKYYAETISIGEKLEYVEYYRGKLITFDYDTFIREQNLNKIVADEVKEYLKAGDVLGLYRRNLEKIDHIITILKDIYGALNNSVKPDISLCWELFQSYSETALFGNYATVLSKKAFEGY